MNPSSTTIFAITIFFFFFNFIYIPISLRIFFLTKSTRVLVTHKSRHYSSGFIGLCPRKLANRRYWILHLLELLRYVTNCFAPSVFCSVMTLNLTCVFSIRFIANSLLFFILHFDKLHVNTFWVFALNCLLLSFIDQRP